MDTVYVIFPCYNEEEGLEKLIGRFVRMQKIAKFCIKLVVVNDGSSDHTLQVVRSFEDEIPIHLIHFENNRGVAAVFNAAFEYVCLCMNDEEDAIVTIDADNTMNPFTILDMVEALKTSELVIASRFAEGGKMLGAGYRAWFSYLAAYLMRWRIGIPGVKDYSIFFRAYRPQIIRRVCAEFENKAVDGAGFSCMANLLLRIHGLIPEARFCEIPLVLRYDQKEGGSALHIGRTIVGYLQMARVGRRGLTGPAHSSLQVQERET